MAARAPYKTHRQQHLGDFLDFLQARGWLSWEIGQEDAPTLFRIAECGLPSAIYRTWDAEALAQRIADREGIPWLPVPYPGGVDRYRETLARISALKSQQPKTSPGEPSGAPERPSQELWNG